MNNCMLEGRLSAPPEERTLPSGDVIVTFRVIVDRDREPGVDTIDCRVSTATLRRRALLLPERALLHVEGRLHRRFFRTASGTASRCELNVLTLRRIAVATAA